MRRTLCLILCVCERDEEEEEKKEEEGKLCEFEREWDCGRRGKDKVVC